MQLALLAVPHRYSERAEMSSLWNGFVLRRTGCWVTSTAPQTAEDEGVCLEMRDENTPLAPLEFSSNMTQSPYTSGGPYQIFRCALNP
jgi:hypothetical protein